MRSSGLAEAGVGGMAWKKNGTLREGDTEESNEAGGRTGKRRGEGGGGRGRGGRGEGRDKYNNQISSFELSVLCGHGGLG